MNGEHEEDQRHDENGEASKQRSVRFYVLTTILGLGIISGWVSTGEIAQEIERDGFMKPYFMVWFNTSFFVITYPLFVVCQFIGRLITSLRNKKNETDEDTTAYPLDPLIHNQLVTNVQPPSSSSNPTAWRPSNRQLFLSAMCLTPVWVLSNVLWFHSLPLISFTINTAVYQSYIVWVFLMSIYVLHEEVTWMKSFSIVFCLGGVIMIAYGSGGNGAHHELSGQLLGIFLVLFSAIFWALYEVAYKWSMSPSRPVKEIPSFVPFVDTPLVKRTATEQFEVISTYLSLFGLVDLLLLWPPLVVLHLTGWERFELPLASNDLLMWVVLNGIFSFLLNGCFNISIVTTSPLFTSIMTVLAIPTSGVVDYFIHDVRFGWLKIVGSLAVIIGFMGMNVSYYLQTKRTPLSSLPRDDEDDEANPPRKNIHHHNQHARHQPHHHQQHHHHYVPTTLDSESSS